MFFFFFFFGLPKTLLTLPLSERTTESYCGFHLPTSPTFVGGVTMNLLAYKWNFFGHISYFNSYWFECCLQGAEPWGNKQLVLDGYPNTSALIPNNPLPGIVLGRAGKKKPCLLMGG
jgi:hypothetical protein